MTDVIDNFLTQEFIKFPSVENFNITKQEFMNRFHMPGVIGAIDCTHVAILKPALEEHNYINRKGFHSLNVQIVCGADLRIFSINANYPGSAHDAFIWRQSRVRTYLHNLHVNGHERSWLLGDSGYPLEPFLLTPFNAPNENGPEYRFNLRHASARNVVERCIGVLKTRFRCLLKERSARYEPQFVGRIVNCCSVLHNMCIDNNVPVLEDIIDDGIHNVNIENEFENNAMLLNEGRRVRQDVVERYFR